MAEEGLWIEVVLAAQRLRLRRGREVLLEAPVSTAARGPGEREGSGGTPRGWHVVRARIGAGLPPTAVLVGRRPTGERYTPALAARHPGRDWILGRILWLSGLEVGRNRLGPVDSMRRYIYIHGAPPEAPMGVPRSHGCIRMHPADLLPLFERVPVGTRVLIREEDGAC